MGKITTKKFSDGIAFYEDGKEFAFYSNITQKVRYNTSEYLVGCTEISFEKNLIVINMIEKYIKGED